MAKSNPRRNAAPPPAEEPQELSLDALSAAFAEAIGQGQGAPVALPSEVIQQPAPILAEPAEEAEQSLSDLAAAPGDHACEISPLSILEALLFVGDPAGGPLAAARLASVMRGVEPREIHSLVRTLNHRYQAAGCPYTIVGEGDGYRLTLRDGFSGVRDKFYGRVRQARLSQAAIDILALVAYRQPLTADEVSQLRGKPSGHVLTQLVRRRLLRIERPADRKQGAHYHTTARFLGLFGLQGLDDLPTSQELEQR